MVLARPPSYDWQPEGRSAPLPAPCFPSGEGRTMSKPVSVASALDLSKPPAIEGFALLPKHSEEGFQDKLIRKTKENPFVPVGMLGTAGALTYGLIAFKQGKTRQSQLLMRTRIFAQGFTVVAILVGVVATAMKRKEK